MGICSSNLWKLCWSHLNHHVLKFPVVQLMLMVNINRFNKVWHESFEFMGCWIIDCHSSTTGFYHHGTIHVIFSHIVCRERLSRAPFACNRKLLLFVPLDCVKRVTLRKYDTVGHPQDSSAEAALTHRTLYVRIYLFICSVTHIWPWWTFEFHFLY